MAITPSNILRHELIGLHATVVSSKNRKNIGISGQIINETYRTLVIEQAGKDKRIFKKQVVLQIELPSGIKVEIRGSLLAGRPWERVKKTFKT